MESYVTKRFFLTMFLGVLLLYAFRDGPDGYFGLVNCPVAQN